MNELKDSWFQFINIDREIKNRLSNIKNMKKTTNPFSIDILNKDERKIVEKYYNKKLSIDECPLFFYQLKYKTKYINENIRDNKLIRAKCNIPHIGQRKLLMTEVWFLSQYNLQNIKKEKEPPIVIYPGAAPGTHILYLSKLFPNVEFHLYDMSRFDINLRNKSTKPKNVFLYNQLFLDEETEYWKQKRIDGIKIYLVSDIRALTGKEKTLKDKENISGDIEIKIIGLRPGEKIYEELLIGNNPEKTIHQKIQKVSEPFISFEKLKIDLDNLKNLLDKNDSKNVKSLLEKLMKSYNSNTDIVDHVYVEKLSLDNYQQIYSQKKNDEKKIIKIK